MKVLTPRPTNERRIDELPEHAEGWAFLLWKSLERRLNAGRVIERASVDVRPRSEEDVAHFELMWKATGRDVYRFTAW